MPLHRYDGAGIHLFHLIVFSGMFLVPEHIWQRQKFVTNIPVGDAEIVTIGMLPYNQMNWLPLALIFVSHEFLFFRILRRPSHWLDEYSFPLQINMIITVCHLSASHVPRYSGRSVHQSGVCTAGIHQALFTDSVDSAWDFCRILVDIGQRFLCKKVLSAVSISQMGRDIPRCFCPVQVGKHTVDINPLPDCRIGKPSDVQIWCAWDSQALPSRSIILT